MRRRLTLIFLSLFVVVSAAIAQTTVKGLVLSSEGNEPVIGASVKVVGADKGVITDTDGNFSISVNSLDERLEVSYIGMITKIVKASNNLKVVLDPDHKQIDEVIVVAYGKQKKEAFTGAAGVVGSETLSKRVVSNASTALAGSVAGVQMYSTNGAPGADPIIRVRGIGSISSSNKPLIILDGVPYDGDISSINPSDIASMTVLKDAASNAIYGARGANGVVMITTKNGNTGDAKVTFDAKWGTNSRLIPQYDIIKDPGLYTQTQFKSLYNSQLYAGQSAADAYAYATASIFDANNGGLGYPIYTVPTGENLIKEDFSINPNAKLGYSDGTYYYTPDDWYSAAIKSSFRQEYNASVSGKSPRLQYYAGVGYLGDTGLIPNSEFKRYSARVNADYQAKKWLRIGTNLAYAYTNTRLAADQDSETGYTSAGNVFYISNNIGPVYPLYVRNADGSIKINPATGNPVYDSGNNTNYSRGNFAGNAVRDVYYNKGNSDRDVLTSKVYAQITPIEHLVLTANIAANLVNQRKNVLYSIFASETNADGVATVSTKRAFGVNNQYLAEYSNTFGKHSLSALLGYEKYRYTYKYLSASNDHLYNPFISELNNAANAPQSRPESYVDEYMSQGIFSRLQYDYEGKYFASASFRRDASSVFHKDHRWGNFGSVGAAWLITKEPFMQSLTWLNSLKLKASWGKQGNDALLNPTTGERQYYAYQDFYSPSYSNGNYSLVMTYKGNKDLTWETSYSFNTGVEFSVLNNRITGSIDFFSRKTVDLIYNKPVPPSSGIVTGSIPTNIGSVLNTGVEVDLNGVILKGHDLLWTANLNLTHYKNKILSLSPELEALGGQKGSTFIRKVGGSLANAYLREYAGVDPSTGEARYYNDPDNGDYSYATSYNAATRTDLGDLLPKLYGGFGTRLEFKGFDFSAMFSYQLGGRIYDDSYADFMHTGSGSRVGTNWHKDILNAWTPENTNTNIPRLSAGDNVTNSASSRFLISSDYLSINNLTLGYTLPKNWLNNIGLQAARVYLACDNLAVFSARKGLDPRYSYGASGNNGASSDYPAMRTVTAGVQVTF